MKKLKELLKKEHKIPVYGYEPPIPGQTVQDVMVSATRGTEQRAQDHTRGQPPQQHEQHVTANRPTPEQIWPRNVPAWMPPQYHRQDVIPAEAQSMQTRNYEPQEGQVSYRPGPNANAVYHVQTAPHAQAYRAYRSPALQQDKQEPAEEGQLLRQISAHARVAVAIHRQTSQLCEFCRDLNVHAVFSERGFRHHAGLEAIHLSAQQGCKVCALCVKAFPKAQYRRYLDPRRADKIVIPPNSIVMRAYDWRKPRTAHDLEIFVNDGKPWSTKARLYTTVDHPLAGWIPGRPCHKDTGDESLIDQLVEWLHVCDSHHPECKSHSSDVQPDYLVFVGDSQSSQLRLRKSAGQTCYIALSHCWGKNPILTTVKSNLQQHLAQIPHQSLPKTFRDAIHVARKLGVHYIWIDSLCILQDNLEHWARESTKMSSIYANAYFTLSATTSPDGQTGFLGPRDDQSTSPEFLVTGIQTPRSQTSSLPPQPHSFRLVLQDYDSKYAAYDHHENHVMQSNMPLHDRAWTLQERLLSFRVISFEQLAGVHMRCKQRIIFERGISETPSPWTADASGADAQKRIGTGVWPPSPSQLPDRQAQLSVWYSLLQEYSKRSLTKQSDKLPAISGLVATMKAEFGGRYLAGLWEDDLLYGLLWKANHFHLEPHRTFEDAPSWSWASVAKGVFALSKDFPRDKHPFTSPSDFAVQLFGCWVKPKTSNPNGQVSMATLAFHGIMRQVDIVVLERGEYGLDCKAMEPGASAPELGNAYMDYVPAQDRLEVMCLRMTKEWPCVALLLIPAEGVQTYQRVGITYIRAFSDDEQLEIWWKVGSYQDFYLI